MKCRSEKSVNPISLNGFALGMTVGAALCFFLFLSVETILKEKADIAVQVFVGILTAIVSILAASVAYLSAQKQISSARNDAEIVRNKKLQAANAVLPLTLIKCFERIEATKVFLLDPESNELPEFAFEDRDITALQAAIESANDEEGKNLKDFILEYQIFTYSIPRQRFEVEQGSLWKRKRAIYYVSSLILEAIVERHYDLIEPERSRLPKDQRDVISRIFRLLTKSSSTMPDFIARDILKLVESDQENLNLLREMRPASAFDYIRTKAGEAASE